MACGETTGRDSQSGNGCSSQPITGFEMSYCFMHLRAAREGDGLEPDFPDGVGFLLLGDLPTLDWGLYEFYTNTPDEPWTPPELVSDELAALIESGKRYPPALALAREELALVFGDHHPSQVELQRAYVAAVRAHLSRQHEAPYLLAPALEDVEGRLSRDEWYWVLSIKGSPPIASWVSEDFHIHDSPVAQFDLTGQQLRKLGYS